MVSNKGYAIREPANALVSVVIPSYRSASVVGAAIDSVLAQTRPPDEIIVVDDGSPPPDNTADICNGYGHAVQYTWQDNRGASAARNTGIEVASGDWLAFLDADDCWDPEKLELQLAELAANPEADFSVTASLVWSPHSRSYEQYRWDGPPDPHIMRAELLVRNIFTGSCSSLLVKRETLEAAGCFAAGKASEDRRLFLKLLERHQGVILDAPLIRQRPGPAHWTNPERHRGEMLSLIEDHADLFRKLDHTGCLRRRALAKTHDRAGMHYLENGNLLAASRDLMQAAVLWPLLPNPWRVLINACLGRLKLPRKPRASEAGAA